MAVPKDDHLCFQQGLSGQTRKKRYRVYFCMPKEDGKIPYWKIFHPVDVGFCGRGKRLLDESVQLLEVMCCTYPPPYANFVGSVYHSDFCIPKKHFKVIPSSVIQMVLSFIEGILLLFWTLFLYRVLYLSSCKFMNSISSRWTSHTVFWQTT